MKSGKVFTCLPTMTISNKDIILAVGDSKISPAKRSTLCRPLDNFPLSTRDEQILIKIIMYCLQELRLVKGGLFPSLIWPTHYHVSLSKGIESIEALLLNNKENFRAKSMNFVA